jgi:hypothetical protein
MDAGGPQLTGKDDPGEVCGKKALGGENPAVPRSGMRLWRKLKSGVVNCYQSQRLPIQVW